MKNIIACLTLLIVSIAAFTQQTKPDQPYTLQEYLKKSKSQKTAGWVLVAAGTGGLIGTLLADAGQTMGGMLITVASLGNVEPEYKSYTGAYVLSTAVVVGGITLFVASAKNKKKAHETTAFLKIETTPVLQQASVQQHSFPSVSMRIRL